MKINFNTMPKMQGFGGNCIGKTTRRNIKGTITQEANQAFNHRKKNNAKQFKPVNMYSNQVLPTKSSPVEDFNDKFITKRSVYSYEDYDASPTTEIEDINLIANNNVDEMTKLVNEITGDNLVKKMEVVDKLDTTEEKKHDILMNGEINNFFRFVDTVTQLSQEENLKRKLDYIDEAYQDEETRKEKHSKFVETYMSNTSSKIENNIKDNGFVNYL